MLSKLINFVYPYKCKQRVEKSCKAFLDVVNEIEAHIKHDIKPDTKIVKITSCKIINNRRV